MTTDRIPSHRNCCSHLFKHFDLPWRPNFQDRLEELPVGETLRIVNDHDPQPLARSSNGAPATP